MYIKFYFLHINHINFGNKHLKYFLGKIDFHIFYRIIRSESGFWIEKFNETIISVEFAELFIMMPDIN